MRMFKDVSKSVWMSAAMLALLLLVACGGGDDRKPVILLVSTESLSVEAGKTETFTMEVSNTEIEWPTLAAGSGSFSTSFGSALNGTQIYTITYTAPETAQTVPFPIKAKSNSSANKTVTIKVYYADPTVAVSSSSLGNAVVQGDSLQFTATPDIRFGHTQDATPVVWALAEGCTAGTLDSSTGIFTAGTANGNCAVTATISVDGGVTVTSAPATVQVVDNPTGVVIETVFVKAAGEVFTMGCQEEWKDPSDLWDDCASAQPVHPVTLTKDFYMGKFEVTQAQWEAVMGADKNPSYPQQTDLPVNTVSYNEVEEFIDTLNAREAEHGTGKVWRLPTETEWEYAARGGINHDETQYSGSAEVNKVGWWSENAEWQLKIGGDLLPNSLGIYDMSGNVYEITSTKEYEYGTGAPEEGCDEDICFMVMRGGSFAVGKPRALRVSHRSERFWSNSGNDDIGFRLVRDAD